MNILAIDSSTRFLCLGLYKQGKIYETNLNLDSRHAEYFMQELKKIFKKAKLNLKDIHCIAVGIGPGSFTGIRIGLALAKGLSFALKKPLIAISTLDILAQNAHTNEGLICPIIDAKRDLVFSAFYRHSPKGIKRITPYRLISPSKLLAHLKKEEKVVFLGDGLALYKKLFSDKLKARARFLIEKDWYPKAKNILYIAQILARKRRFSDLFRIKPLYLYPKDCQVRKRK